MKTYPKTLAAVKNGEKQYQWAIGDALLAECGPPSERNVRDGSREKIREAAEYLFGNGFEYSINTLAELRDTAYAFSAAFRGAKVAWGAHRTAGTPEYLEAIIAGAPKGTKITQNYIESIRRVQAEHARIKREEEAAKAQAELDKAEEEEIAAQKEAREAKTEEEKETASVKVKKAATKTKKAQEKKHKARVAPKPSLTPPEKEEVPQMVAEAQFMAHASKSVALARQAAKDIEGCLDQLTPVGVAALTELALEAVNAWTDAANVVRSKFLDQRGHLSVVGE